MLVSNPCDPDYRVIKQAESLARMGHRVRIFCKAKAGVADLETINGVEYQRLELTPPKAAAARAPVSVPNAGPPAARGRIVHVAARTPSVAVSSSFIDRLTLRLVRRSASVLRRVNSAAKRSLKIASSFVRKARSMTTALAKRGSGRLNTALRNYTKFGVMARVYVPVVVAWHPDIVHAHDLVCLPAGRRAARLAKARLVYDSHELETHRNPPLPPLRKRFYRFVEGRSIRKADAVITVCKPIAGYLQNAYRIRRPHVIFNAPDISAKLLGQAPGSGRQGWRTSDESLRDIRAESGVPATGKLGIYVGLVTINRGIETMIDALPGLGNVWFVAVGPSNEKYNRTLMERAKALGVAERFRILPPVHPDRVVDFIAGADFGVNPLNPITLSYAYAMPNKLFEMSFAGLAIVNSDAQESARFVTRHGLGVIFRHNEPVDLTRAVKELSQNIGQYRPNAARLRQIQDTYGWHRQEETLARLYAPLLPKPQPAPQVAPTGLRPAIA